MIFSPLALGHLGSLRWSCDLPNLEPNVGLSQAQTQASNSGKQQEHGWSTSFGVRPPYSASLELCDHRQVM